MNQKPITTTSSPWAWVRRVLHERTILVLSILFLTGIALVLWDLGRLSSELNQKAALESAAQSVNTLREFRTLYTSEVVARVRSTGVEVVHDYTKRPGAIPLPATLSMMLGEKMGDETSGGHARLYSPFPFPWRRDTGGLQDNFSRDAWSALSHNPSTPFYRFEDDKEGRWVLRYAEADLMRPSCVNCHNTHPDTPKHDWKTGDLRGVLEYVQPMDAVIARTREGLQGSFLLVGILAVMGLGAFNLAVTELRHASQEVKRRAVALEHEMAEREKAEAEREELNKQLIYTSRRAGMAEVATGVLHNVGNILTSVSVSAGLIRKLVQESSVEKLQRTTAMLHEHRPDVGAYLTHDPKGQLIPEYLNLLSEHLAQEHATVAKEAQELATNIEHINQVIQAQQTIAHSSGGHQEPVAAQNLMEQALLVNTASLDRHQIDVIREYAEVPQLITDRHQVLQILVNLISNAKYAALAQKGEPGRLTLRIGRVEGKEGVVQFQVQDNGVGIKPEHLTQIFAQGFTTKKEGHGFGLHMAALSAKYLSGTLTVHSGGKGQGATFTLELPVEA